MSADRSYDPYARIADLYEAEHRGWTDDLDLYRALAARAGDPVLELGCGSGRVAIALADAGFEVRGIDTSEAMLAIAHKNLGRRQLPVTFGGGDMRHFASHREFGLVFCALDTLLHLPCTGDVLDTMASAHRALRPGGLLAFDIVNPTPDLLAMGDRMVRHQSTFAGSPGTEIAHFVSWDIDPEAQTIDSMHFYDWLSDEGVVQRRTASLRLRYLEPSQVMDALRSTGFGGVELYGNAQLDPFTPESERMICVAAKSNG